MFFVSAGSPQAVRLAHMTEIVWTYISKAELILLYAYFLYLVRAAQRIAGSRD